jgi:uncharacterized membrane protein YgcG
MMFAWRSRLSPLFLVGVVLAVAPSPGAAQVKDHAGLFQGQAVQQADQAIREIQQKYHKDLVVETFASIPDKAKGEEVKGLSPEARNPFFETWAKERARELKVDGIYLLICKEPLALEAISGWEGHDQVLRVDPWKPLVQHVLPGFREQKYDELLLETVRFVDTTLGANFPKGPIHASARRSEGTAPLWESAAGRIGIAVAALIALGVVIGLIRGRSRTVRR